MMTWRLLKPRKRASSSSRRRQSQSHGSKEGANKRVKLLDITRGESVVKSAFLTNINPTIKEEIEEVKNHVIDRLRISIDGGRPKEAIERKSHSHSRHSTSRHRKERDNKDKYRTEKEKEARKVRKEAEKQMIVARDEVEEGARRQREKDDEEREIRREQKAAREERLRIQLLKRQRGKKKGVMVGRPGRKRARDIETGSEKEEDRGKILPPPRARASGRLQRKYLLDDVLYYN